MTEKFETIHHTIKVSGYFEPAELVALGTQLWSINIRREEEDPDEWVWITGVFKFDVNDLIFLTRNARGSAEQVGGINFPKRVDGYMKFMD